MAANDEPCCKPMFWIYFLICVLLVLFAGLMSGLTLGLMSLSLVDLEVLAKAGKPEDKKNAAKILPVVKNQHLLLCTLLLGNSLAMEALPIFLDALVPAWGAIVISVTLILAFGEIIPQAVCSRYGLKVGAKLAVVVRILLWVFLPITYPISMLLDCLLGKGHFALLRRAELKTLVDMHGNEAGKGGELTHDETTIISGALDLTQKTAKDVMTPISEAFSLDINSKLDMHRMESIITAGHSRVPIHAGNPTNIIGLILVKNLLSYRPEDEAPIRNLTIREIQRVRDDKPLYEVLNLFQSSRSHMAVVVKPTIGNGQIFGKEKSNRMNANSKGNGDTCISITSEGEVKKLANRRGPQHSVIDANLGHPASPNEEVIGIITMEDVIEELLQEEILDETDEYVEVHSKLRVNMVPRRKLSPRSPGATILSHHQRRSPLASPLAPYHHSPTIMSPSSPSIKGPPLGQSPIIYSSPIKSTPSSPAQSMEFPPRSSPTSHRVSRKPYEKLTRALIALRSWGCTFVNSSLITPFAYKFISWHQELEECPTLLQFLPIMLTKVSNRLVNS